MPIAKLGVTALRLLGYRKSNSICLSNSSYPQPYYLFHALFVSIRLLIVESAKQSEVFQTNSLEKIARITYYYKVTLDTKAHPAPKWVHFSTVDCLAKNGSSKSNTTFIKLKFYGVHFNRPYWSRTAQAMLENYAPWLISWSTVLFLNFDTNRISNYQ